MYLSEMLDAVESKTGKPLFPQEERKADPPVEQIINIPKAENAEPPDDPPEPTLEQEE